jgi:hypothetical protein
MLGGKRQNWIDFYIKVHKAIRKFSDEEIEIKKDRILKSIETIKPVVFEANVYYSFLKFITQLTNPSIKKNFYTLRMTQPGLLLDPIPGSTKCNDPLEKVDWFFAMKDRAVPHLKRDIIKHRFMTNTKEYLSGMFTKIDLYIAEICELYDFDNDINTFKSQRRDNPYLQYLQKEETIQYMESNGILSESDLNHRDHNIIINNAKKQLAQELKKQFDTIKSAKSMYQIERLIKVKFDSHNRCYTGCHINRDITLPKWNVSAESIIKSSPYKMNYGVNAFGIASLARFMAHEWMIDLSMVSIGSGNAFFEYTISEYLAKNLGTVFTNEKIVSFVTDCYNKIVGSGDIPICESEIIYKLKHQNGLRFMFSKLLVENCTHAYINRNDVSTSDAIKKVFDDLLFLSQHKNIILIDPTPHIFHAPALMRDPDYPHVDTLIEHNSEIIGNCSLLLNWIYPSETPYDVEAIDKLKPIFIYSIFEGLGGAGSTEFHRDWLRYTPEYTQCYIHQIKLERNYYVITLHVRNTEENILNILSNYNLISI